MTQRSTVDLGDGSSPLQFVRSDQSAIMVEGIIRQDPVLSLSIDGVLFQ